MQVNQKLIQAKKNKNDEFYTQLPDIEKELIHYTHHFEGKHVYLNCDNPSKSMFYKYFNDNFNQLKLKKLSATYWDGTNGDFRSEESIALLKEADIVVTNPPFSLFREFIKQLIDYNKKFLIIGSVNAITYKEVFKYIKNNKIRVGYNFNKTMEFKLPDDAVKWKYINENNIKIGVVGSICWFTNLDINLSDRTIISNKKYYGHEEDYPKYDNYNAIEVSKVKDIPVDYYGVMGVPVTFLGKYNPKQFKIVGMAEDNGRGYSGGVMINKKGNPHATLPNGKNMFKRIFIKRINPKNLKNN